MFEYIITKLANLCERNGSFINITGTSPDDVYLIRYYVIPRNSLFNIYIHLFMRSDADDFHDHPWNFYTWIVRGSYKEEQPTLGKNNKPLKSKIKVTERCVWRNRFAYRKATDLHRVTLVRRYTLNQKDIAPMTLCITGPTIREWGFIKKGKWVNWKTYLKVPKNSEDR